MVNLKNKKQLFICYVFQEPKAQNSEQIKEIYRIKLKQLEQKKIMNEYLKIKKDPEIDQGSAQMLKSPRSVF